MQLPITGCSSSTVMLYICLGCPGGTLGERFRKNNKKMFSHCSLSLCPQQCIYKVIEPRLVKSPKTPFLLLTVSLGQIQGA